MELKLSECSVEKFIEYAEERKRKYEKDNKYNYSYITKPRLQKVFEFMCERKTKCKGSNYHISDIDGFISEFSQPEKQDKTIMEECLFNEVWCKCEWIYRIIDYERNFYESLKGNIGSKNVKMFETV